MQWALACVESRLKPKDCSLSSLLTEYIPCMAIIGQTPDFRVALLCCFDKLGRPFWLRGSYAPSRPCHLAMDMSIRNSFVRRSANLIRVWFTWKIWVDMIDIITSTPSSLLSCRSCTTSHLRVEARTHVNPWL